MSLGYVWRVKEKNLSIPFAEVSYFKIIVLYNSPSSERRENLFSMPSRERES